MSLVRLTVAMEREWYYILYDVIETKIVRIINVEDNRIRNIPVVERKYFLSNLIITLNNRLNNRQ